MKFGPLALCCLVVACKRPDNSSPRPTPPAVTQPSSVGMVFRPYVDTTRRNWAGDGPRPLTTAIWYPTNSMTMADSIWIGAPARHEFLAGTAVMNAPVDTSQRRRPLVVLSHGTGGAALQLMWLGQYLAGRGFIVAAVNHHGNTGAEAAPAAEGFVLWWERARDLSRVIDALLADSAWAPRIDTTRIGAAGFSLGGYTMIEVAGGRTDLAAFQTRCARHPDPTLCDAPPEFPGLLAAIEKVSRAPRYTESMAHAGDSYRDPRIKAVFAIAPAQGGAFTAASLAPIRIPVVIVAGDSDDVAPPASNAATFAAGIAGATVHILPGVGHYTFLSLCTDNGKQDIPRLCRDPAGTDRAQVHRQVADSILGFLRRQLEPGY